jgi:glucose-1-phosphatase
VLFDLDGVLVAYDRRGRMEHLGNAIGCTADAVFAALFESGLEDRYDAGDITTDDYLATLGESLGCQVDRTTWSAARTASMHCAPATCARIAALSKQCDVAVLTNNGALIAEILPTAIPDLFPSLDGRVFCSGALGASKPSRDAFLRVVDRLGHVPHRTLFLDDNMDNVEGARAAGLFAEHVAQAGEFNAILGVYGLR